MLDSLEFLQLDLILDLVFINKFLVCCQNGIEDNFFWHLQPLIVKESRNKKSASKNVGQIILKCKLVFIKKDNSLHFNGERNFLWNFLLSSYMFLKMKVTPKRLFRRWMFKTLLQQADQNFNMTFYFWIILPQSRE